MAIRAAAAELEAAADEGEGDLRAARVLVFDFVGVERGLLCANLPRVPPGL
jgi:hypothetical protein